MRRPVPYILTTIHIALATGMASASGFAGDMGAECPARIPESSIKADQPIAGWVTAPMQMHLQGAGMMAGPPETQTYLVPNKNTQEKQTFEFDHGDGQRWLWCGYGGVRLARRLDDRATSCTITMSRKKPELSLTAAVQCK